MELKKIGIIVIIIILVTLFSWNHNCRLALNKIILSQFFELLRNLKELLLYNSQLNLCDKKSDMIHDCFPVSTEILYR